MSRKGNRGKSARCAIQPNWLHTIVASRDDTSPKHALEISNKIRVAYQLLRDGQGTDEHFDRVAAALNVGMIRAEAIGQPVVAGIVKGMEALMDADRLNGSHGRYGFSGPGILAMNCALDLYDEILRNSTPRQMQLAAEEGARRMRRGEYLRAPPSG